LNKVIPSRRVKHKKQNTNRTMAKVKIEITGNAFGIIGQMWHRGKQIWVDEKQAELLIDAGAAKVIQTHQPPTTTKPQTEEAKPAETAGSSDKPSAGKPGRKKK